MAKVLLADQLSRSCFRGSAEDFSYDLIGRELVRELVRPEMREETLKLPGAILYLLPWALAHSEDLTDLQRACEVIDMAINAYPDFKQDRVEELKRLLLVGVNESGRVYLELAGATPAEAARGMALITKLAG